MGKNAKNTLEVAGLEALSNEQAQALNGGFNALQWAENVSAMGWGTYWHNVWRALTSW